MVKDTKPLAYAANNGYQQKGSSFDFDPSAPPPFKIAEIRASIPKHCWVKNPWRSLSYVLRDVLVIAALVAAAIHFDNWLLWLIYCPIQGTMFWALNVSMVLMVSSVANSPAKSIKINLVVIYQIKFGSKSKMWFFHVYSEANSYNFHIPDVISYFLEWVS